MTLIRFCCFVMALVLAGCVTMPSPELRRTAALSMATAAGWESVRLLTSDFTLAGFVPRQSAANDTLTIYIEGDGLAWVNTARVSPDPTPMRAVGLELALRHPHGAAAYLARPCQYVEGDDARNCSPTWWSDRRFGAEVVAAADQAVGQLKQRFQAKELELVGYSGGGAIAALVAARRSDVARLVTVAGNLDHPTWTKLHHLSPLTGSLNPADAWLALAGLPQLHFIGKQDRNVSQEVAASYQARFPEQQRPELRVIDGFDHSCCWVEQWPVLYSGGDSSGN